ncbi:MAG: protein-L-isoaspartate O-methyltransferase [Pseudomonadota bacterium]
MVDISLQRKNMVESQVRPNDITDRRIIRAMAKLPRELFLPQAVRPIAYMDEDIPLSSSNATGSVRALMAPRSFAKLVQLADISETDIILDVGTATGYSAAVLANLCETVVALEADNGLAVDATKLLEELAIDNVVVVEGELEAGFPDEGPFDAIVIEGTISQLPEALLDQLKDGGRLVAVVDSGPVSHATIWRRIGANFDSRVAFDVGAPPLPGFEKPQAFTL